MPTNEERREAAARFRAIADLIEPEPERTCHMTLWYGFKNECSNCGIRFYIESVEEFKFCPYCGAKVVGGERG